MILFSNLSTRQNNSMFKIIISPSPLPPEKNRIISRIVSFRQPRYISDRLLPWIYCCISEVTANTLHQIPPPPPKINLVQKTYERLCVISWNSINWLSSRANCPCAYLSTTTRRRMEENRHTSTYSLPRHWTEAVSFRTQWLYAGEDVPGTHKIGGLVGPHRRSEHFGKGTGLMLWPGVKFWFHNQPSYCDFNVFHVQYVTVDSFIDIRGLEL